MSRLQSTSLSTGGSAPCIVEWECLRLEEEKLEWDRLPAAQRQSLTESEPGDDWVPFPHGLQELAPLLSPYFPELQSLQEDEEMAPLSSPYFPFEHEVQDDAPLPA